MPMFIHISNVIITSSNPNVVPCIRHILLNHYAVAYCPAIHKTRWWVMGQWFIGTHSSKTENKKLCIIGCNSGAICPLLFVTNFSVFSSYRLRSSAFIELFLLVFKVVSKCRSVESIIPFVHSLCLVISICSFVVLDMRFSTLAISLVLAKYISYLWFFTC